MSSEAVWCARRPNGQAGREGNSKLDGNYGILAPACIAFGTYDLVVAGEINRDQAWSPLRRELRGCCDDDGQNPDAGSYEDSDEQGQVDDEEDSDVKNGSDVDVDEPSVLGRGEQQVCIL
ncbi:hypothetical protein RJ55_06252 [Drechmeria coniospora]|nr:hypothetical protein RJ55_06252 [Drechmeria coniospora]